MIVRQVGKSWFSFSYVNPTRIIHYCAFHIRMKMMRKKKPRGKCHKSTKASDWHQEPSADQPQVSKPRVLFNGKENSFSACVFDSSRSHPGPNAEGRRIASNVIGGWQTAFGKQRFLAGVDFWKFPCPTSSRSKLLHHGCCQYRMPLSSESSRSRMKNVVCPTCLLGGIWPGDGV